ncbi:MAG TPA: hypothetical protein VH370_23545 [Humisphaera sp.]|jgi:hypothetical protein|nr:hypothetical protein [Humisphaera sp.]
MSDTTSQSGAPHGLADKYEFDAEFRGETLHYIEATRRTSMIWTWTNGYRMSASSMTTWSNSDGAQSPVSNEERLAIIDRAVKYAHDIQHVKLIVED